MARLKSDAEAMASSLEEGQPVLLTPQRRQFGEIQTHLKWASEGLSNPPDFRVEKGELFVYARSSSSKSIQGGI